MLNPMRVKNDDRKRGTLGAEQTYLATPGQRMRWAERAICFVSRGTKDFLYTSVRVLLLIL